MAVFVAARCGLFRARGARVAPAGGDRSCPMPSSSGQRTHTIAVLAALVAAAGILAFLILRPGTEAQSPPGVVQPTEIKIAPEISGRLSRFVVVAGQSVQQGDILAEIVQSRTRSGACARDGTTRTGARRARPRLCRPAPGRDRFLASARSKWRKQTCCTRGSNFSVPRSLPRPASPRDRTSTRQKLRLERRLPISPAPRRIPSRPSRAYARGACDCRCQGRELPRQPLPSLRRALPNCAFARRRTGTVALFVAEPAEAIVPGQPILTLQAAGQPWASFNLREDQLDDLVSARVSSW